MPVPEGAGAGTAAAEDGAAEEAAAEDGASGAGAGEQAPSTSSRDAAQEISPARRPLEIAESLATGAAAGQHGSGQGQHSGTRTGCCQGGSVYCAGGFNAGVSTAFGHGAHLGNG